MALALGRRLAILVIAATTGVANAAPAVESDIETLVAKRCARCHGATGQSSDPDFPKLAGQNADYLVRQLFNFKSRARKSLKMEPRVAGLSGNEMERLAAYFSSQRLIPAITSEQALVEEGRVFYFRGNPDKGISACAVCHGPKGRGGQMLPRLAGQHAEYLERQLRGFIERSRTTDQTLMHSVATKMTDDDIRAVSYFLSGFE